MKSQSRAFYIFAATLFSLILAQIGVADSATWNLDPISRDWSNALNWTPNTVPNDPADVATFGVSNFPFPEAIAGTFSNLADGASITVGNNTFQADYQGGDGNDLTLTVIE